MTVGAAIVAYHTAPADLEKCLSSLSANEVADIAVVDNSPTAALRRITEARGGRYFPQEKNRGFAASANYGAEQLRAETILFLNPDAYLYDHALEPARRYLTANTRCGAVGLLLSSPAGKIELTSFGAPVTPLSLFTRRFRFTRLPTAPQAVGWVSGGAMLVRQRAWQKVNGFDPEFFLYWEDVDVCRRLTAAGWEIVVLPGPGAIHRRGASLPDARVRLALYDESADKYFAKHYAKTICLPLRYLRRLYRLLPSSSGSLPSPG